MLKNIIFILFLISFVSSHQIWPQPHSIQTNKSAQPLQVSPCDVKFIVQSTLQPIINVLLQDYNNKVLKCSSFQNIYELRIVIKNNTFIFPTQIIHQKYSITIRTNKKWQLTSDYYPGFVKGFQTFTQLFYKSLGKSYIKQIPIFIDDQPNYKWRGLMIDSSRHFLPLSTIYKTIDGLMYSKMNVLHWHIIDQDSFPIQIPSIPQLNQYGYIGGNYTVQQIKSVLQYAKIRGIRVVVEIDTPAHTHSWGRSQKYHDTVVRCNSVFTGQFDPTLNLTYELVTNVLKFVNNIFDDPYIHFGGDETSNDCWDLKPSIKEWMLVNNISSYMDLSIFYRKKQKKIWRQINKEKKAIYWANQYIDLPLEVDDAVQWWGSPLNLNKLKNRPNQVILSSNTVLYLDRGFGNRNGLDYGSFITWRQIYSLNMSVEDVNVVGAQSCMWSELSHPRTHEQKIWTRTNALAQRLWNSGIKIENQLKDIVYRLISQVKRMKSRGFKMSPVSVQICENDINQCF